MHALDHALDSLLALRGVTFEYIDPAAAQELPGERIGMIAQEVEAVFPDWVEDNADGYKRLTVRGFEALTVEALRQLREEKDAEIAEQSHRIDALQSENDALRARIEVIERAIARSARN